MSVPTHKEWRTFKKAYGVADKAAKNVSVGAELDKYWKTGGRGGLPKANLAALTLLSNKLKTYGATIDKKKVKKYDPFKAKFQSDYLNEVKLLLEAEAKRLNEGQKYKKELDKFFTAAGRLGEKAVQGSRNIGPTLMASYRNFATVQVQALKAARARYGDTQPAPLSFVDPELDKITQAFNRLPANPGVGDAAEFIRVVDEAVGEIKDLTDSLVYVNVKG